MATSTSGRNLIRKSSSYERVEIDHDDDHDDGEQCHGEFAAAAAVTTTTTSFEGTYNDYNNNNNNKNTINTTRTSDYSSPRNPLEVDSYDTSLSQSPFTIDDYDDDDDAALRMDDRFDLEHDEHDIEGAQESSLSPLSERNGNNNNATTTNTTTTNEGGLRAPQNYICPLTLQLMDDPVNDICGHCFERRAIQDWLEFRGVCPISRKPMQSTDLFHNGHLKLRIQEWKEDHPLYQHADQHYAQHQMNDMLSLSSNDSHSKFELMLLPQERQVLNIVKVRAERRRKDQEHRRRMWTVGIVVTVFVVIIVILALLYGDLPKMGPG